MIVIWQYLLLLNKLKGYAKRNGICTKRKACAIVQENGFSRAIDIAHEIGHT